MILGLLVFLAIAIALFALLLLLVGVEAVLWITAAIAVAGTAVLAYAYVSDNRSSADDYDAIGLGALGVLFVAVALVWTAGLLLVHWIGG